jgi:DNA repair protein RadC
MHLARSLTHTRYKLSGETTEQDVLAAAEGILRTKLERQGIDCQKLFTGTVDGASVHPREVVRAALSVNACAAILAHNHPSGVAEPSAADRAITHELREALRLIGVRVLDHIVVGADCVSMAGRGLM